MTIYHYTSLRDEDGNFLLQKILNSERISFRATYFEQFDKMDYQWVRNYSKRIVRDICEKKGEQYDKDMLDCQPYIISFSTNKDSDFLWKKCGLRKKGICLAFDSNKLLEAHATDGEFDCILPCKYIPTKKNVEKNIIKIAKCDNLKGWDFFQQLKMAVVAVRKQKFQQEEEIRYISLQRIIGTISDKHDFEDYIVPISEWQKYIEFPKDALVGITLGSHTSDENLQEMKEYVKKCGLNPDIVMKSSR